MKNDMLKFLVTILLFGVLLLVCDRGVALLENKLYAVQENKINYVNEDTVADVVILGSSRASHHYVPQILMDSLNMTCVNLGEDGQGILYNYIIAQALLAKHTPRVIIYEFGSRDYVESIGDDIEPLSMALGENEVYNRIIEAVKPNFKKATSMFHSYRYNSRVHKVLMNTKEVAAPLYGYEPLYGSKKDGTKIKQLAKGDVIDTYKVEIMKEFIQLCKEKGVLLIGVSSPRYGVSGKIGQDLSTSLFVDASVPYFDYTAATFDTELFIDNGHLNDEGAVWFSSRIASELKKILQ